MTKSDNNSISIDDLIDTAISLLNDDIERLENLDSAVYRHASVPSFGDDGTYAKHWQHIIGFYEQFLDGYSAGEVNYDARRRCDILEEHREVGIVRGKAVASRLLALRDSIDNKDLSVTLEGINYTGENQTNTYIELGRIVNHHRHHQPYLRIILHQKAIEFDPALGYAHATMEYKQHQDKEPKPDK